MLVREAGYASARHHTSRDACRPATATTSKPLPRLSINGRYQQIGYVRTMLSGLTVLAESRKAAGHRVTRGFLSLGSVSIHLNDHHGRQHPQEAGQEEIEQVHPGAGFRQLRHRDRRRDDGVDDHEGDQDEGPDQRLEAHWHEFFLPCLPDRA